MPALAQEASARVVGTVTDESGGRIVGARVTVEGIDTGRTWRATTGNDGYYQVLDVPIGTSGHRIEKEGFSKLVTRPTSFRSIRASG